MLADRDGDTQQESDESEESRIAHLTMTVADKNSSVTKLPVVLHNRDRVQHQYKTSLVGPD